MSLILKIPKQFRDIPFSTSQAVENGISKYYLKKLLQEGVIEGLSRRIYRVKQSDISEEDTRDLKLFRIRDPQWNIGIEEESGYAITFLERSRVDTLTHRAYVGSQIGIEALRRAVEEKKTPLNKILEMANKLGVAHRIRAYIEALA